MKLPHFGFTKGADLELLQFQHPFMILPSLLFLETTSPQSQVQVLFIRSYHGQEDFTVGNQYNLEVANPVGSNGVYLPDTELCRSACI